MATSSKKATRKKSTKRHRQNPLAGYVHLRTMLDSLEIGALRYYLDCTTGPEKKQRLEEMETALMPIIQKFWGGGLSGGLITCPRGYTECYGVCVPYSCVQGDGGDI